MTTLPNGVTIPGDAVIDGNGNYAWYDPANGGVVRVAPDGTFVSGFVGNEYVAPWDNGGVGANLDPTVVRTPGTPGAFAGSPLPVAPGDIPDWARQAFFGGGLSFDDFGRGVVGGTAGSITTTFPGVRGVTSTSSVSQALTPGTGGSAQQADAFAQVKLVLDQAGLGGLAGWAWEQILNDASADELYVALRQTEAWKQRFGKITTLRQQASLPPMSEGEILAYESGVRSLFRQYGLPEGFYDQAEDIAFLAGNNVSLAELNDRVVQGFVEVQRLPGEVRSYFRDVYGPGSDAALTAFFLDPDKALPVLERNVAASVVGGVGRRYGFDIGVNRAEDLARFGVDTVDEAAGGFRRIDQVRDLLSERLTETQDFTADNEGFDFGFGLGGGGERKLQGRLEERVADFAGSAGSGLSRSGSTLGSASDGGRR